MSPRALLPAVALLTLAACAPLRGLKYLGPDVRDGDRFPSRPISASPAPVVLAKAARPLRVDTFGKAGGAAVSLDDYLVRTNTNALVVLRGDSIVYEYYAPDYGPTDRTLAYSVTKSYIGVLIGIAIGEGLIGGVDDPVRDYLPELRAEDWDDVTLRELLQMTSGNAFREDQHPFHESARFYYGGGLGKRALRQRTDEPPGARFEYRSGDTQLLTQVLAKAVAPRTVTAYLEEKLWQPLGATRGAHFNVDERGPDGIEKGSCCLNATARDHLRLGMAMRDGGRFDGRQVIPAEWVAASTRVDSSRGSAPYYQYQWWLGDERADFLAEGIINQFIYVDPESDVVIVKQSRGYGVWNKWRLFRGIVAKLEDG